MPHGKWSGCWQRGAHGRIGAVCGSRVQKPIIRVFITSILGVMVMVRVIVIVMEE